MENIFTLETFESERKTVENDELRILTVDIEKNKSVWCVATANNQRILWQFLQWQHSTIPDDFLQLNLIIFLLNA